MIDAYVVSGRIRVCFVCLWGPLMETVLGGHLIGEVVLKVNFGVIASNVVKGLSIV